MRIHVITSLFVIYLINNIINVHIEKYLSRKQRVNGSSSDYSSIESGVPQGSVLGPLLFLVYINDLGRNIKSNIKLFADDAMLFSILKILKCLQLI